MRWILWTKPPAHVLAWMDESGHAKTLEDPGGEPLQAAWSMALGRTP